MVWDTVIVGGTEEVFWGRGQHGERAHREDRAYADMTVTVTVGEAHLLGNPLFLANVKKTEVSSLHGHLNLCN